MCQSRSLVYSWPLSQPTHIWNQMGIAGMLEQAKCSQTESHGGVHWQPPNQTGWKHVQTHGSVDLRHVPADDGHLCPCLFQLTQIK